MHGGGRGKSSPLTCLLSFEFGKVVFYNKDTTQNKLNCTSPYPAILLFSRACSIWPVGQLSDFGHGDEAARPV
jgi:hypothetical protein